MSAAQGNVMCQIRLKKIKPRRTHTYRPSATLIPKRAIALLYAEQDEQRIISYKLKRQFVPKRVQDLIKESIRRASS